MARTKFYSDTIPSLAYTTETSPVQSVADQAALKRLKIAKKTGQIKSCMDDQNGRLLVGVIKTVITFL